MKHFIFITFFISSQAFTEYRYKDFENNLAPCICEIKKIDIPQFPHAFNPSIVRWQEKIFMSFRLVEMPLIFMQSSSAESKIGIIELDAEMNPIGHPYLLCLNPSPNTPSRPDDPRLVTVDDQLYMIYSDNRDPYPTDAGYREYIAELGYEKGEFFLISDERITFFDDWLPHRREKNWAPFNYYGYLLLTYTMQPFKIYYPLLGEGVCMTMSSSWNSIDWRWGDLRGGTPALPIEDEYLGIFHSCLELPSIHSSGAPVLHYFMGAYTFTRHPPFLITKISQEPLVGPSFYHGEIYNPYWKPVRVVFPCGLLEEDAFLWVSYGRQDHEMWLAKIDKEKLLESLVPVATTHLDDYQKSE